MPETNVVPNKKPPAVDGGTVSLRVSPELREQLNEAADANDKTVGEFCRQLLEVAIDNPDRKLNELARSLAICCSHVERASAEGTLNEDQARELVEKLEETKVLVEGPRKGKRGSWWWR